MSRNLCKTLGDKMRTAYYSIAQLLLLGSVSMIWAENQNYDKPHIEAFRSETSISIDGKLEEQVWQRPGYTKLIQRDPDEGAEPTQETEVFLAYDDHGLYVAGICHHSGPDTLAGGMARRDEWVESDWFWFWIDRNLDRQNGFGFAVNPSGSIRDTRDYRDIQSDLDWNGVWEAAAQRTADQWSFEMFIPYSQLRFDKRDSYTWGVNFKRYILSNAENDYFVMVPKDESGFFSHFGYLTGIKGIKPPARLFISPYVMAKQNEFVGVKNSPFEKELRTTGNLGVDIKYGLSGNLTLDLAVNPDFGQAEVDPAVINLSAFETYYSEKRTFFLEGADIFRFGSNPTGGVWGCWWSGPTIFYSRRIGRQPAGNPTRSGEAFIPEQSTILGAAKVSGKIRNWSVGSISALTQKEYALIDSSGVRLEKEEIEPPSYYGIYRGLGSFNDGQQGLGFIFTHVHRNQDQSILTDINNDQAVAAGVDGWTYLGKDQQWAFMGNTVISQVQGTRERVSALQQSSSHYYQRPDYESVDLDTNRTSLSGFASRFGLRTIGGNFHAQAALGIKSPGFNVNDLGYNSHGNIINASTVVGYQWLDPTSWFRELRWYGMTSRNFDFDGNRVFAQYYTTVSLQLLNYWSIGGNLQVSPEGLDLTATRGGPLLGYPAFLITNFNLHTDSRKDLRGGCYVSLMDYKDGSFSHSLGSWVVIKPAQSLRITLSMDLRDKDDQHHWVDNIVDDQSVYGYHYIFSDLDYTEVSTSVRLDWGLTPTLSIQGYFQPFLAVADYRNPKELAEAASYEYSPYAYDDSDLDFNSKSFRGNMVLRWEYQPGSLLYIVWTQNRANYDDPGEFDLRRDLRSLSGERSDHIFYIKLSHMFSVL